MTSSDLGRQVDVAAAQAHGAGPDDRAVARAHLGLDELLAAAGAHDLGADGQGRQRHRPQELAGEPHDRHVVAGLGGAHRLGHQRRGRAAVQGLGIPGPAGVARRHEQVALAAEDRLGRRAQRSSLRITSRRPDQVSSIAATFVSTSPSGRATSRTTSSVTSVATPEARLGHATQIIPAGCRRSFSPGSLRARSAAAPS